MPEALSTRLGVDALVSSQVIDRNVRLREVERITGLSRSSVYRLEAAGQFPRRVKLSARASAWKLSELQAWSSTRPRAPSAPSA
jgi:prophage regulatory protein